MAYQQERKKIIKIRGAKLMYRPNFSGDPSRNYDGKSRDKNFTVVLEDEKEPKNISKMVYRYDGKPLRIKDLEKDGWNIKTKEYEDGEIEKYITVKLNWNERHTPQVFRGADPKHMRLLNDATVGCLEDDYILNIDLDITPSMYSSRNDGNYDKKSAYVRSMFVIVEEDELEEKYGPFIDDENQSPEEMDDSPF